jgi:DNA-binding LacI/PurR family transcriptional regulator
MNKTLQVKKLIDKHIARQRMSKQYRLPAERVLASQLGFSRATIGKALGVLEGEGVIFRKKGAGTFIAKQEHDKSMSIALVMRTAYHYTDMHFRLIVDEVSKYAEKNNIYIQIFDRLPEMFKADPENNPLMQAIRNKVINGVLIVSRMPLDIISKIYKKCPTVSINNVFGNGEEVPCISCDYFRVGFLAGKHLSGNGHRKVAYVTENLKHPESIFDFSGFQAACEMAGVEINSNDILETKQNVGIFEERVTEFFRNSGYTGCFIRNSYYAVKVINVLKKSGSNIPEDLSVISAGQYKLAESGTLKLTVIDNQLMEMCHYGLEKLQKIANSAKNTEGGLKLLKPKIIENGSVINLNLK